MAQVKSASSSIITKKRAPTVRRSASDRAYWAKKSTANKATWYERLTRQTTGSEDVLAYPFEDLVAGLLEASHHRVGPKRTAALMAAYRDSIGVPGQAMREHRYQPLPVRRVWIPKPGTKKQRPLGVPAIRDRVAEEAMRRVMEPIWEPTFSPDSYGFRPGRSVHDAVHRIFDHLAQGYHGVVDADIQDCFGSIDQPLLIDKVAERISDGTVLGWIRDRLRAGVMDAGQWHATPRGTSQGSVISPLMANISLDALDHAMAGLPGVPCIRYADDWCALARTKEEAEAALTTAQKVLMELRLTLHPEKTRIVDVRDTAFDFWGWSLLLGGV